MASEEATYEIIGKFVITSKTEVDDKFQFDSTTGPTTNVPLTFYILEFDGKANKDLEAIKTMHRTPKSYIPEMYKRISTFEKPMDVWGSFDLKPWLVQEAKTVETTHPRFKSERAIRVSACHSLPSIGAVEKHLLTSRPFYFWTVQEDGQEIFLTWKAR